VAAVCPRGPWEGPFDPFCVPLWLHYLLVDLFVLLRDDGVLLRFGAVELLAGLLELLPQRPDGRLQQFDAVDEFPLKQRGKEMGATRQQNRKGAPSTEHRAHWQPKLKKKCFNVAQ
jgi:hypothetical protein